MAEALLQVKNLVKHFPITQGIIIQRKIGAVHAVDDVSFDIYKGETLGLVGESGCGKSTTGRTIIQLYRPTSGQVIFEGIDLVSVKGEQMRKTRRRMQMIFQDPYASLNPRMTIGEIIAEPLIIHKVIEKEKVNKKVSELLELVGLNPQYANRYPHEFSGGQRQRVGVARSLSLEPSLIICDEPISALDVSIQAQVVNLLEDLQSKFNLTYLFIAHDLSMVRHISNRIAVMYLGVIVEEGPKDKVLSPPYHPYTEALLSSLSVPRPHASQERIRLEGAVPSAREIPAGCRFHTRCPRKIGAICETTAPPRITTDSDNDHFISCHIPLDDLKRMQPVFKEV